MNLTTKLLDLRPMPELTFAIWKFPPASDGPEEDTILTSVDVIVIVSDDLTLRYFLSSFHWRFLCSMFEWREG